MTRFSRSAKRLLSLLDGLMTVYAILLVVYLLLRLAVGDGWWWLALLNNFAPYYFLPILAFVPLALLLRRWWTAARLLPLILVAALWFGPYYLPKARAVPADTFKLKIATFNLFPGNQQLENVYTWLKEITADVVLLQEIPGQLAENGIPELRSVYPYQTQVPTGISEAQAWGNMVLSRYPLLSDAGFDLEKDGSPTHQRITVDLNGQEVAVYNVHLLMPVGEKARLRLPDFLGKFEFALQYDDSARNAQISRLLALLDGETLPYIAAGDFNLSDQSVTYGKLAAVMSDTFREAGVGFGASWPSGESEELPDVFPPLLRVDYVWHSDHFRAVEASLGPKLGSDHLPLVGVLSFR